MIILKFLWSIWRDRDRLRAEAVNQQAERQARADEAAAWDAAGRPTGPGSGWWRDA